ncbi:MAG: heavy metal translocating P-type ATPase metal-binding domain-containing protein [bacterium]|nr:heavy metal translocating P-type ATPase metal-binding domain-containing protein [bacterium]
MPQNSLIQQTVCYHCGENCNAADIHIEEKEFCCQGCKMVYEIVNQSGLCEYYDIDKNPGINQKIHVRKGKHAFLDNEEICNKLIHFSDGTQKHVTFYLPQMHCSSCIWLLEQLNKLNKGVMHSTVNFLKKDVTVIYNSDLISLRQVAELLTSLGYEPHINLHDLDSSKIKKYDRSRIYKIGIAGFCFGNIMLLSFPEYFSSGDIQETQLKSFFSILNIALSLPVFFYCSSEFFMSAYAGLRKKFLNIDAPIALAIFLAFIRSLYEIGTHTGAGYLDSMSGIVFFMLVGRFFQDKTYQSLTFDRDYTSYFPISVILLKADGTEDQIPASSIKKGDRIRIHSHEIIPADGILFLGKGNIDYSFVSGESMPVEKGIGEIIYAGGKQIGGAIELEVVKEVAQSYLTQLWNDDVFTKKKNEKKVSFVHQVSRYFTYVLFLIAFLSAVHWSVVDPSKTWNAVTAILIVACPCALLLSATFTNGNMLAKLHGFDFFVKNAGVLESISEADTLVFDKTGTLSISGEERIHFVGPPPDPHQQQLIRSLAIQSIHPLSKAIAGSLPIHRPLLVKHYVEEKGKGSTALVNGEKIKMGSAEYVTGEKKIKAGEGSNVFVSINDDVLGFFVVKAGYRPGLETLVAELKQNYNLSVISGDNDSELQHLKHLFGEETEILFQQHPQDKLEYIKALQTRGHKVIMLGDGLNDAGALQQSNVGIAITDEVNNFSPGCDAILDGKQFAKLKKLLDYCGKEKNIIYGSFIISILYNIVGLSFAVQGTLSPVIAAILMPLSSITIVVYTTLISSFFANRIKT